MSEVWDELRGCGYCGESGEECICEEDDEPYPEPLPPTAKALTDIDFGELPF